MPRQELHHDSKFQGSTDKFMKIKEYLDIHESHYGSGDSHHLNFESQNASKHAKKQAEEVKFARAKAKAQFSIHQEFNLTSESERVEKPKARKKQELAKLEVEKSMTKLNELKQRAEVLKISQAEDEANEMLKFKEPIKFTIPLSGKKFNKALKKNRLAFEDSGSKENNKLFGNVASEDRDGNQATPESFFRENFESIQPVQKFKSNRDSTSQKKVESSLQHHAKQNVSQFETIGSNTTAQSKKKQEDLKLRREAMKKYDKVSSHIFNASTLTFQMRRMKQKLMR